MAIDTTKIPQIVASVKYFNEDGTPTVAFIKFVVALIAALKAAP